MHTIQTPVKQNRLLDDQITIPPSPFMKCLGFGTGVSVYRLNRSPVCSQVRSPWAIKTLTKLKSSDTLKNRLKDEATILKNLNHPNIVGFRALTNDNRGAMCLAMEACTTSLGNMIESRNEDGLLAFPAINIATVMSDIAKALHYLHNEVYILHCDVKSYNILIQGNFEICKLCDFGISIPLQSDGTVNPKFLSDDACLGSGPWMAPEAALSGVVTSRSDIYSYGLVIWEMVALTIPPSDEDDEAYPLEESQLNNSGCDSLCSINSSKLKCIDWRPELPAQEFSEDYYNILEVFYCCTVKEAVYRPSAELLVQIVVKILENLTKK